MALYQPSLKSVSACIAEIADSAGASADPEMKVRAGRSLDASIKYFNAKVKWRWLQTEHTPISIVAPFTVSATATNGQASALLAASADINPDDWLAGSFIRQGTRVSAHPTPTLIGLNTTILGSGASAGFTITVHRDLFDLPSNYKSAYSVRLLTQNQALKQINRRVYDRSTQSEYQASTPQGYDVYAVGEKGKIRLVPSPNASDTLELRYYRRMQAIPASATGSSATLDVPDEYDPYVIAWAKWHFLTDKEDGMKRGQTWLALAKEGLSTMLTDQNMQPDEDLMFQPGHVGGWPTVNSPGFAQDVFDY